MNLRAGELWGDTLVAAGKPWRPVFAADKRSYAERMIAAAELGRAFESGVGFRPATPEEKEEARRIAAELIRLADEQDAADAPFQRRSNGPHVDHAATGIHGERVECADRTQVTRIWTHAPPLVTLDWRWGLRDGDREPSWLVAPAALTQRAHVRGRLTVDPEYKASCPWREATAAFRATALSWVEEVKTLTRSGVRAPAVAEAVGLDNKLHAFWNTLSPAPADDLRHGAINALWDLQDGGGAAVLATIAAERNE